MTPSLIKRSKNILSVKHFVSHLLGILFVGRDSDSHYPFFLFLFCGLWSQACNVVNPCKYNSSTYQVRIMTDLNYQNRSFAAFTVASARFLNSTMFQYTLGTLGMSLESVIHGLFVKRQVRRLGNPVSCIIQKFKLPRYASSCGQIPFCCK